MRVEVPEDRAIAVIWHDTFEVIAQGQPMNRVPPTSQESYVLPAIVCRRESYYRECSCGRTFRHG